MIGRTGVRGQRAEAVKITAQCGATVGSFPVVLEFRPDQIAEGIRDLAAPSSVECR